MNKKYDLSIQVLFYYQGNKPEKAGKKVCDSFFITFSLTMYIFKQTISMQKGKSKPWKQRWKAEEAKEATLL